jgi:hypothetical protein
MKNSTKKTYTLEGRTVSYQKWHAVNKKIQAEKKAQRTAKKSARQRERRSEQRIERSTRFGPVPWMKGNPPAFGTRAASRLKANKAYAFHAAIKVTGDLSSNRGLGAIKNWYAANAQNDFDDRKPKSGGYMIYPFIGNFTPEEMAMIPAGDTRTNAEIRIQAVITDLIDRGADTIDTKGVFVSGVMGGGKGLR